MTNNEQYLNFIQNSIELSGGRLHYRKTQIGGSAYVCLDLYRDDKNIFHVVTLRRDVEANESIDDCLGSILRAIIGVMFKHCPESILKDTDVSRDNGRETIGTNIDKCY